MNQMILEDTDLAFKLTSVQWRLGAHFQSKQFNIVIKRIRKLSDEEKWHHWNGRENPEQAHETMCYRARGSQSQRNVLL